MAGGGGHSNDFGAGEDENDKEMMQQTAGRRWKEFDCPECSANNPVDDTFGHDDEVTCHYCGSEFKAHVSDEGRLKLKSF